MARKLKTFTTSVGFFDLAISAPSMKAALEAWDAGAHLFHHGFARQTDERSIVAATMARPGVVLRRAVGSKGPFTEHVEISATFMARKLKASGPKQRERSPKPTDAPRQSDGKATREAALAFVREQKRRERQSHKEEAALEKEGERRDRAIAAAQAALEEAGRAHKRTVQALEKAQAALDKKSATEQARWTRENEKLQDALRRARSPRHLRVV